MTESSLTGELKTRTEASLPPPVVFFKHSDAFTAGIPDVSVTWRRTLWVEVKYVRPRSSVRAEVLKHPLQLARMVLLEKAARRAVYLIYEDGGRGRRATSLWLPTRLKERLDMGEAMPLAAIVEGSLVNQLAVGGAAARGFDHGIVARLMKEMEI